MLDIAVLARLLSTDVAPPVRSQGGGRTQRGWYHSSSALSPFSPDRMRRLVSPLGRRLTCSFLRTWSFSWS